MSSVNDFNFLFGAWNVEHRKLQQRLAGCDTWDEFTGTSTTTPTMGGAGNVEQNNLDDPNGPYHAVALRAYDIQSSTWSIWWLDGRSPTQLDSPVVGGFVDDVGIFECQDTLETIPIVVRFTWLTTDPDHPQWEQAFSADNGTTWETNWTMRFSRND